MIPLWGWVSLGSSSSRIIWSTWFSPIAVTRANCDKLGFFPSSFILWIFYNYTPLIAIVRKKTTNIFNICIYIHTIYTTPNKKLFKFCWVHMFLPQKTHPWVIFFPGFPCRISTHEDKCSGPATGSQTAWNRADRVVVVVVGFRPFFFQRPVLKLTLLGIDRVVGSVFFNFMIWLSNIDFFKYQAKINGRFKNSMSKCLLPVQDSVQAVCIIVCIICLVIRIMTSLAADC